MYQRWNLEGGWIWNYVCVTVELLSSLYTKLNSWVYINRNCKYKKDVSNAGLFGFLYLLLFSGRNTPRHINNTHISLNCLTLSSEAPREEREWKKWTTVHCRKMGQHARALLLLFAEGPQAVRCWRFKKKSRVFKQNLLATFISPTASASFFMINCTVTLIINLKSLPPLARHFGSWDFIAKWVRWKGFLSFLRNCTLRSFCNSVIRGYWFI